MNEIHRKCKQSSEKQSSLIGMVGYLTGAIQIDAVDVQIVALVVFDLFVEFLVDGVGVEQEFGEVGRCR